MSYFVRLASESRATANLTGRCQLEAAAAAATSLSWRVKPDSRLSLLGTATLLQADALESLIAGRLLSLLPFDALGTCVSTGYFRCNFGSVARD